MNLMEKGLTLLDSLLGKAEANWAASTEKQRRWKYLGIYTVLFLFTFAVAYSPLLRAKVSFIWTDDGRNQFFPLHFYTALYLKELIAQFLIGNFSIPLYDICIGVGDGVISFPASVGLFADPFYVISAILVPLKYSELLLNFMSVFHLYLAGLTFSYMCRYFGKAAKDILIGSLLYCFSGYIMSVFVVNPIWFNAIIALPLLIVGAEKILRQERSYCLFILSVMWTALCAGFYFLYMSTVVTAIYVLIRFWRIKCENKKKYFFSILFKGTSSYLLGIGLCGVIFVPTVAAFFECERAGHSVSVFQGLYPLNYYFSVLFHLISPPGNLDELALPAIVLPALILLFALSGNKTLKILVTTGFAFYMCSFLAQLMNGLQYPSNRWIYALALLLSYVVVEMLPKLENPKSIHKAVCLLLLLGYLVVIFFCGLVRTMPRYLEVGLIFLSLSVLAAVIDLPLRDDRPAKKNLAKAGKYILILGFVILNIAFCGFFKFDKGKSGTLNHLSKYGTEFAIASNYPEREILPYIGHHPTGRADSTMFSANKAMACGVPTLLPSYNSILNKYVSQYWIETEVGGIHRTFTISNSDYRTIQNTLASQLYHMEPVSRKAYVPYGYRLVGKTQKGNEVYKNNYALPWGYTYEESIPYEYLQNLNGLQKQELMLRAIAIEGAVQKPSAVKFDAQRLPYRVRFENCNWRDGVLNVGKANAKLIMQADIPAAVELYLRLDHFDISADCEKQFGKSTNKHDLLPAGGFRFAVGSEAVTKGATAGPKQWDYYFGRENYLFNLGYSDKERHSATITFPRPGTFKLKDIELYALPMTNYPARVNALRAEPLKNIEWGTNKLSGTVDLTKDKILCVSVPYSKGWSATVDGKEEKILRGNYMFMALPLKAGHHDIVFSYCPPGLKAGAVLTLLSWGILAAMLWRDRRKDGASSRQA